MRLCMPKEKGRCSTEQNLLSRQSARKGTVFVACRHLHQDRREQDDHNLLLRIHLATYDQKSQLIC